MIFLTIQLLISLLNREAQYCRLLYANNGDQKVGLWLCSPNASSWFQQTQHYTLLKKNSVSASCRMDYGTKCGSCPIHLPNTCTPKKLLKIRNCFYSLELNLPDSRHSVTGDSGKSKSFSSSIDKG